MFLKLKRKNLLLALLYTIFLNNTCTLQSSPTLTLTTNITLSSAEEIEAMLLEDHCEYFAEKTNGYGQDGWIARIGGKTLPLLSLCNVITMEMLGSEVSNFEHVHRFILETLLKACPGAIEALERARLVWCDTFENHFTQVQSIITHEAVSSDFAQSQNEPFDLLSRNNRHPVWFDAIFTFTDA